MTKTIRKNDSALVSIVVPVFNVADFLSDCLESIQNQTYKNFEVILVNDGSSDESGRICDKISKDDPKFTVIHQENAGLSAARNTGLKYCKGSFVTFIDSDDIIADSHIGVLVAPLINGNADVSVSQTRHIPNQQTKVSGQANSGYIIHGRDSALKQLLKNESISVSACSKMAPIEFWEASPFPQGLYYEDLATTFKVIAQAKAVAVTSAKTYGQVMRKGSITRSVPTDKHIYDLVYAIEHLRKGIQDLFGDTVNDELFIMLCVEKARLLRLIRKMPVRTRAIDHLYAEHSDELKLLLSTPEIKKASFALKFKTFISLKAPKLYDILFDLLQFWKRLKLK